MQNTVSQRGFTLLEIVILVVILAVIGGGYEAGVSLIESAKQKAAISEIETIKFALNTFQVQYQTFPGDIENATAYWPGEAVKDGNGDGEILWSINKNLDESLMAWKHLYLAGMFDENLTGLSTGAVGDTQRHTLGVNLPEAAIDGTGFLVRHTEIFAPFASDPNQYLDITGNYIQWASIIQGLDQAAWPNSNDTLIGPALGYAEAIALDAKYDDGLPYSGRIVAENAIPSEPTTGSVTLCTYGGWSGTPTLYVYIATDTKGCRMLFFFD